MTEYHLERKVSITRNMAYDHVVVNVYDAAKQNALLILECFSGIGSNPPRIQEATVCRAGDYPMPAYVLVPGETAVSKAWDAFPIITTIKGIPGLEKPIVEVPDRSRRVWGPTRFIFGGRGFVRKPLGSGKNYRIPIGDSVHEYTSTTPKPGSKTGKLDDDALSTKLFSIQYSRSTDKATVHAAEGLDPLFLEYLFAVHMFRIAAGRPMSGVTAPNQLPIEGLKPHSEVTAAIAAGTPVMGAILGTLISLTLDS